MNKIEEILESFDLEIRSYSKDNPTKPVDFIYDKAISKLEQYVLSEKVKARKTEIEFLYDIADDDLKNKLKEVYKYRGVNLGLSFTSLPENDAEALQAKEANDG